MIINELMKLTEDIFTKKIPQNEIPKKVVNIVEEILNFRELKIVTPKQMIQRLPITHQRLLKAGNILLNEILLNEILKIIYSSYRLKEIT